MIQKRNSSFELLRIILIIMILVEHGNMWFIGSGYSSQSEHLAKSIVESLCIGSVNAFVLISGWFGINNGLQKIGKLVFLMMFCTVPLFLSALLFGWLPFTVITSISGVYEYVFGGHAYWFVIDYIGLLIISPLLNLGATSLGNRQLKNLLLVGYTLILIYDFVFRSPVLGTEGGYSVLWFAFLYLLARYMRTQGLCFLESFDWLIFIIAVTAQSVLFYFGLIGMRYTNPLILLESICLILIFKKWNFHNHIINFAASACLMTYLLHMQPVLVPYIRRFLTEEYIDCGYWLYMLEISGLSIGVFLFSILLDRMQSKLYQIFKNVCYSSHANL